MGKGNGSSLCIGHYGLRLRGKKSRHPTPSKVSKNNSFHWLGNGQISSRPHIWRDLLSFPSDVGSTQNIQAVGSDVGIRASKINKEQQKASFEGL